MNHLFQNKQLEIELDVFFNYVEFSERIVLLCNSEGNIIYQNKKAREYFRFFSENDIGRHLSEIFESFPREDLHSLFEKGWTGVFSAKISSFENSYAHLRCRPVYDSSGKNIAAFYFEISETESSLGPMPNQTKEAFAELIANNSQEFALLESFEKEINSLKKHAPLEFRPKLDKLESLKDQLEDIIQNITSSGQKNLNFYGMGNFRVRKLPSLFESFLKTKKRENTFPKIQYQKEIPNVDFYVDSVKIFYVFDQILKFIRLRAKEGATIKMEIEHHEDRQQIHIKFLFETKESIFKDTQKSEDEYLENRLPFCKQIIELHKGSWKLSELSGSQNEFNLIFPLNRDPYLNLSVQLVLIDACEDMKKRIENLSALKKHPVFFHHFKDFETAAKNLSESSCDILIFDPSVCSKESLGECFQECMRFLSKQEVFASGNLLSISSLWEEEKNKKELLSHESIRCYPKSLSETDLEILIQNEIALVKKHRNLTRDFDDVKKESLTDALTNLSNRRRFEDVIPIIIQRADNRNLPVTFIMIDIDHFKHYNDNNGHQAGDELLKLFARVLKSEVRVNDLVARWGGEEFIVILPNASRKNGLQIAEKLRSRIENTFFLHAEKQPLGKVSASFGVSIFPEDSRNIKELIRIADNNLYLSKKNGRNRVTAKTSDSSTG